MSLQQVFSETSTPLQVRFDVTTEDRRVLYKPLAWRPVTQDAWTKLPAAETIEQAALDATVRSAGWQMDLNPTALTWPQLMYSFKKVS